MYGGIALIAGVITGRRAVRLGLFVVALAVTAIVAYCRMYRGFHYPTDVIVGFVLGAICLAAAWILFFFFFFFLNPLRDGRPRMIVRLRERVRCRHDHDPDRCR